MVIKVPLAKKVPLAFGRGFQRSNFIIGHRSWEGPFGLNLKVGPGSGGFHLRERVFLGWFGLFQLGAIFILIWLEG